MGIFDRLFGPRGEQRPPAEATTFDVVASTPGNLDAVGGLDLPPGRPVGSEGGDAPIAWVTDQIGDHAALWARLAGQFAETGLWPVLASGLDDGDLSRPWFDGELAGPDPEEPRDVLAFLTDASASAAWVDEGEEQRDYRLRGLAAATRSPGPVTITLPAGPAGLLLVPVTRPADVPRALGWMGPANYDFGGADQSAVLGSWEDRFGAVLVGMGFDVMQLVVAAPPTDHVQAELLAREHYAFCPDNIDQGVGSLEDYVPLVMGREWYFWWD
jgi:hypothetical protein